MNWQNAPIGTIRKDELVQFLNSLILTGGCDHRTLQIVAAGYGLDNYLIKSKPVIVELVQPKQLEQVK